MGGRDVRTVVDGGGDQFPFEPGAEVAGYEFGHFFRGTMSYTGESDEIRVEKVGAKLGCRAERYGAVTVAPEDQRWGVERSAERAPEVSHVVVPGLEEAQQVKDGARGAEVVPVGLEARGSIPALGAGHAAEADHLKPFGKPGHDVSEGAAGLGEIEADERIGFVEVRMCGRDEDE